MRSIKGSGGGKGSSGVGFVAREDSDSLQSNAIANVVDLLGEGEIVGLVNGLNSVYLNETPVIDANGSPNFKNVQVVMREGTQSQEFIPGFAATENEQAVSTLITNALPVVRTITNNLIDAVRITISLPVLTKTNSSTGEVGGSEVAFKIEVNSNGAGYVQVANDTIVGKATSKYQKSYRIELPEDGPHQIRITRVTADAVSQAVQDKLYWDSYTEIIDAKLKYPNSALAAIKVDAANFSSIPTRAYHVRLLKIKIPSNYDPEARSYSSDIWDGEFQVAWSNNPAWILYDLLTNSRYGCGLAESEVDKWSLYQISQYCDAMVDNGFGGKEPRFTCNCYFQTRTEAYNLIKDLSTVFRGISYWQGGLLNFTIDAPEDPSFIFTPANVIDGVFNYNGTSKKDRYTEALVTWNDPSDFYRQKVEYVPHHEGIARYGIIKSEIVAFGCTSQGQAHRMGRWLLYTSLYETELVNFTAGPDSGNIQIGQIIKIADPVRAGARRGGRLKSSTINSVVVDQDLNLIPGSVYTLFVMLANGNLNQRTFTSEDYEDREITVSTDFDSAPHSHGIWAISSADIQPQTFKIVGIAEVDGKYQISALAHDPNKFDYVEDNVILEERSISNLSITPGTPTGLAVTENLYSDGGSVKTKVTFSWESTPNAIAYVVTYRKKQGNIVQLGEITSNEVEILGIDEAIYDFTVIAVSILGLKSKKASIEYEVKGKTLAPNNVEDFSIMPTGGSEAEASWKQSSDLDVLQGGSIEIRYSKEDTTLATWQNSVRIGIYPGNTSRQKVPLLVGTYLAKFIDSSGNFSVLEAMIYTDILKGTELNVVAEQSESPEFAGIKTNMAVSDEFNGLVLTGGVLIDDIADFDSIESLDYVDRVVASGSYKPQTPIDLSERYTARVTVEINVVATDILDTIDSRVENMDEWEDFDGSNLSTVNAELFMRTTDDDPSDPEANWSEYKRFFVSEYTFRGIDFLLVATSTKENHTIVIKELKFTIDIPDRIVHVNGLVSDAAGTTIVYEKPFKEKPAISITAKDMNTGDYYRIDPAFETVSGFKIEFFDSAGTGIVRKFDYLAKGYGRQNP